MEPSNVVKYVISDETDFFLEGGVIVWRDKERLPASWRRKLLDQQ